MGDVNDRLSDASGDDQPEQQDPDDSFPVAAVVVPILLIIIIILGWCYYRWRQGRNPLHDAKQSIGMIWKKDGSSDDSTAQYKTTYSTL